MELHTLMEASATVLALNVGVLALVRSYSKKDNTFLDANGACLWLSGYTKDQFLSVTPQGPSAEVEKFKTAIPDVIRENLSAWRVPLRDQKKKDGTVFLVEIVASVFAHRDRKEVIGATIELTERDSRSSFLCVSTRPFSQRNPSLRNIAQECGSLPQLITT
jgi:PAS domain S-box-containing protein